ncbi:MAG: histidine kinase [Bacteroidetes bacterium HGW-Bacteroidetes-17]|jgi:GAF domain-containing protein|nr:MAG: histidine kinase [Bacteroidetes bacterium HGW-Bacteroidetes-17]
MDKTKKLNRYKRVYAQLDELLKDSTDPVANQSTIIAVLHHKFDYFFWTGYYRLIEGELIVGPYQGAVACIHLKKNTGVCWAAINSGKTVIVSDVHDFAGHIACDSRSKSEIVIPVKNKKGEIMCVLDVDSQELNSFDEADAEGLEKIVELIYK